MTSLKRLLVLAVAALAVMAAGNPYFNIGAGGGYTVQTTITEAGDSAMVMTFTPSTGLDSFAYTDSFSIWNAADSTDTTRHRTVTFTSPPQEMRLDVGSGDTTVEYACTLDCGTNKYGFVYAHPETVLTQAQVIDRLVDSINNVAGMKDTVLAQDSVTYIKVKSKIPQIQLEGDARWTMKVADSLDTATIHVTDVAEAIAGLVAAVNADTAVDGFVTAANSGDTLYTITSDDQGLLFYAAPLDTTQDTATTQTNITSESGDYDTITLGSILGYKTVKGYIKVDPTTTGHSGQGLSCSTYVWLETARPDGRVVLACDTANVDSAQVYVVIAEAVGDTLLGESLYVIIRVWDTLTDTTYESARTVTTDLILQ